MFYVTLCCPIPPKEKFSPSLADDINPESSHWNNGKMKIACNAAYIQTETLNFTFAWQAVIVYCYICFNHRRGYCHNVTTLVCVTATICGYEATMSEMVLHFCKFLINPHFDLEPHYIV